MAVPLSPIESAVAVELQTRSTLVAAIVSDRTGGTTSTSTTRKLNSTHSNANVDSGGSSLPMNYSHLTDPSPNQSISPNSQSTLHITHSPLSPIHIEPTMPFSNITTVNLHLPPSVTTSANNTNTLQYATLTPSTHYSPQPQLLAPSPVLPSPDYDPNLNSEEAHLITPTKEGHHPSGTTGNIHAILSPSSSRKLSRHSSFTHQPAGGGNSNNPNTTGLLQHLTTQPSPYQPKVGASSFQETKTTEKSSTGGGPVASSSPLTSTFASPSPSPSSTPPRPLSPRPTHSKEGRKCCFCFSGSTDPKKRLSFVTIVTLLVVGQVLVSCVLVWMLGYLSTLTTVSTLTSTIRTSLMHDVEFELNQFLQEPLQAAYDINFLLGLRWPDLANRTIDTITNEDGWLSELSYIAMRYPQLSRVGFATRNNVYVLITKGIESNGGSKAIFSSAANMSISVAMPAVNGSSTVTLNNYRPTPLRPPSTSVPPFNLQPEILRTDTANDIARYLGPPILPQSGFSVTSRPFYQAAVDVANQGLAAGWSGVYSSSNIGYPGSFFLAIAAVHTDVSTYDGSLGSTAFAVTNLDNLNALLYALPLGSNGFGYFIRANGHVVSSSVPSINDAIRNSVRNPSASSYDLNMFTSDDEWLQILAPILLEWNLVTQEYVTPRNSSLLVPYRPDRYETSVNHGPRTIYGASYYHVQAIMLNNATSGLPLAAVIVTKDSDFDADVRANILNTVLLSLLVLGVAICVSTIVTRCISRPMMVVVDYMERSCKIIEMERSEKQRKELSQLCEEWSSSSGMVLPPLLTSSQFVSMAIQEDPRAIDNHRFFCCGSCCDREVGCLSCGGVGRSLREVQSMHRAFGSMLYSLASYDELEAINHAKRQFIRYIFHEVRVPFNAIVLGIEQMEMELREHTSLLSGALDTLSIISEQSQVVSRILNDVLSMQKIEDGALTLEYDVFSMEKMIRGSLYAFRSPCMDKRIKVKVALANIDEYISTALPAFRIGQVITAPNDALQELSNQLNDLAGQTTSEASRPTHERHQSSGSIGHADLLRFKPAAGGGPASSSSSFRARQQFRGRHSYMHRAYVRGDPYRLRQVFSNLLTNAVKFSPLGGKIYVTLEVSNFVVNPFAAAANASLMAGENKFSLHPQPTTSSNAAEQPQPLPETLGTLSVRVSVRDSGPGVPEIEAAHLFQAYMQVNAGKQQKGNGTGLGLSISKSIVELHGGMIGYKDSSNLPPPDGTALTVGGGGAEFYFTIPLDVTLVKSRSSSRGSHGGGMSVSQTSSHLGSLNRSSHDTTDSFHNMRPEPTATTRTATLARPRPSDESHEPIISLGLDLGHDGPLTAMEEEELRAQSSDPILSPHVGLVHRVHTIDMKESTLSQNLNVDPMMLHALRLSPRRDNISPHHPSHPSHGSHGSANFLSPRSSTLGLTDDSLFPPKLGSGVIPPHHIPPHHHPTRSISKHHDSVVDIVPLAESGIGTDGELETSVSRIQFHETEEGGGEWDHIEQDDSKPQRKNSSPNHERNADSLSPLPTPNNRSSDSSPPPLHPPIATATGSAQSSLNQASRRTSPTPTPPPINPPSASPTLPRSTSDDLLNKKDRPLPTKLEVLPSPPAPPPPVSGTSSSGSSGSVGGSRATQHAIDLASFISEETKAHHKASGGVSGSTSSTVGWVASNSVHLSTSSPNPPPPLPSSSDGSNNSNPSTPFISNQQPPSASKKSSKPPTHRSACRVLVVEDSLPNRKLLVSLLGRSNCVAQGVEDGQQCIDLFAEWMVGEPLGVAVAAAATANAAKGAFSQPYPFDIILMDGTMPVMNGIVATQLLRGHGIEIPIVAVTGNALAEDVGAFMMAGANAVLTKPVNLKELQAALAQFCPANNTPSTSPTISPTIQPNTNTTMHEPHTRI